MKKLKIRVKLPPNKIIPSKKIYNRKPKHKGETMETSKVISLSRAKAKTDLCNFFNRATAECWLKGIEESGVPLSENLRDMSGADQEDHDSLFERLEKEFAIELDRLLKTREETNGSEN
jgi:hypothetical protein